MLRFFPIPNELACGILAIGLSLAIGAKADAHESSFALGFDCGDTSQTYPVTVSKADSVRSWGVCTVVALGSSNLGIACRLMDSTATPRLDVRNSAGTRVRSFAELRKPPFVVFWDGRDDQGADVPLGVYRVRFTLDRRTVEIPICRRRGKGDPAIDLDYYKRILDAPLHRDAVTSPETGM